MARQTPAQTSLKLKPKIKPLPVFIFHNITHARAIAAAAAETNVEVEALTAPGAMRYLGGALARMMAEEAALPNAVADCSDISESVQIALRAGWKRLLFVEPHPAYDGISSLARAVGAEIMPRAPFFAAHPHILDLGHVSPALKGRDDFLSLCTQFLKNLGS